MMEREERELLPDWWFRSAFLLLVRYSRSCLRRWIWRREEKGADQGMSSHDTLLDDDL